MMTPRKACCWTLFPIAAVLATLLAPTLGATPDDGTASPQELLIVGPGEPVRLRAAEPGTIVEAAIGGGLLVPAPDGEITAPAEAGDHWLISAARDAAGLRSALRWTRLRVDATAPTVTLSLDPPPVTDARGRQWAAPSAAVTAVAEDSEAGPAAVELIYSDRGDHGGGHTLRESGDRVSGPLGTPPQGEETITLHAIGEDAVGNRSARAVLEVVVDTRPPTGRIFAEGPWTRRDGVLILGPEARLEPRGRDRESGLAGFEELRLDGAAVEPDAWGPPWSEGEHTAEAVAVDRVGNRTALEGLRFTVDSTPPELTWRVLPDLGGGSRIEVRGTDSLAGIGAVEWSRTGASWTEIAPVGPVTLPADGILLRASDRAGNQRRVRLDASGVEIATGGEE